MLGIVKQRNAMVQSSDRSISGCIFVTTKGDGHLEDISRDIVPNFQLSTLCQWVFVQTQRLFFYPGCFRMDALCFVEKQCFAAKTMPQ